MALDDYIYVALILVCIPLGAVVKRINGYTNRLLYCGLVGFTLGLLALQTQIWHSLLTIVVSYLILKYSSIRYVTYTVTTTASSRRQTLVAVVRP